MNTTTEDKPLLLTNIHELVGRTIAVTDWVDIDQIQVNVFGEVSRWHKPGHCDPEHGRKGPYGGTLIHGFHMVSLLSHFVENAGLRPRDGAYSLNYGLDKVRVLQPVVIGDGVRIRSNVTLANVTEKTNGQRLIKTAHELEAQGVDGPVMYAEYLSYWYPRP
ncbi:MAG: MaoC/PaaZ C-terminal domain-containing protein [Pseudomonadales bacterium]|nr:MaoC/PaaZ C-terminal domain-containing protein [Pseudomonadales bacterium]MDP6970141.1 MaoC/PaaZ C-terminal domain-containing protein [Pseudomonadales bacterium]